MGNLGELLGYYLLHNLKAKKIIPNIHVLSLNLDDFYVLRWEMKKMVDSTIRNPAFGMYGCSNAVLYF